MTSRAHTPTARVVLVRPQIATNTGNIIRLCANVGATLHLVEPLGFRLDESSVKRAGLDYHELADVQTHPYLDAAKVVSDTSFALTAHAEREYHEVEFNLGDTLVFGAERDGLSADDLARFDEAHRLRIPMMPDNRSLNLANAVAIVAYELWRQHGFVGAASNGTFAEHARTD